MRETLPDLFLKKLLQNDLVRRCRLGPCSIIITNYSQLRKMFQNE